MPTPPKLSTKKVGGTPSPSQRGASPAKNSQRGQGSSRPDSAKPKKKKVTKVKKKVVKKKAQPRQVLIKFYQLLNYYMKREIKKIQKR